jgi:putative transposase
MLPVRKPLRLSSWNYAGAAAYYVTLCVAHRVPCLSRIGTEGLSLTREGHAVLDTWRWLGAHHAFVRLDAVVVMPDHLLAFCGSHGMRPNHSAA